MYSFKKYTHSGQFVSEIAQDFIKNTPSFHETINSGQGECSLQLSDKITGNFIKFGDLVKIFFDGRIIYSGFVIKKEHRVELGGSGYDVSLVGVFDSLRNFKVVKIPSYIYYTYQFGDETIIREDYVGGKFSVFYNDMINYLKINESNIYNFDIGKVNDTLGDMHKRIEGSFLDLLNFFNENRKVEFFIGANGRLKVTQSEENMNHILIFGMDIAEVVSDSDILNLANDVTLRRKWEEMKIKKVRVGGSVREIVEFKDRFQRINISDEASIQQYGVKFKDFGTKEFYEEVQAREYLQKLLDNHKVPIESIKLRIFNKKWFGKISPLDNITVKNFKKEIVNKKIVKVSYRGDYMEVELESYNTLGQIILGQSN